MKNDHTKFELVKKVWTNHTNYLAAQSRPEIKLTSDEFIRNFFCAGPSYHYILDSPTLTFDFVSDSATEVLGVKPEDLNLPELVNRIHPDDIPFFYACEDKVASFLKNEIPPEKMTDYKIAYTIRERIADGSYRLFLLQTLTLQTTLDGALLKVMGVHTDISHITPESNGQLSLLGLNGEPSYFFKNLSEPIVVQAPLSKLHLDIPRLTSREYQILKLLANGLITKEIAGMLHISIDTVITHRKNMIKKANVKNTVELVAFYLRHGHI